MGHYENLKIDRSEGWKYKTKLGPNGDDYHARVWIDDKGEIDKNSFSREYQERNGLDEKSTIVKKEKKEKNSKSVGGKKKEAWWVKLLKAPFRFLWWLIKLILKNGLSILTFGIANGWFEEKKK